MPADHLDTYREHVTRITKEDETQEGLISQLVLMKTYDVSA